MYTYIIMERTQIYLSQEEVTALEREAAATGRSKSQLIRDAIDRVYLGPPRDGLLVVLARSHGRWKGRDEDGATWVEHRRTGRLARIHREQAGR